MVRRSVPAKITDDRKFRFRVKFRAPDRGGWNIRQLYVWLDQRVGIHNYAIHFTEWSGVINATAVHLNDLTAVTELVAFLESVLPDSGTLPEPIKVTPPIPKIIEQ